jgi:phospholipase/carboxylesterase
VDARVYEGTALSYVLATPDGFAPGDGYPLVVLLHGFGASMYDLAGLAPAIDATGYVYAFPNAPYALQIGAGATGYSWATGRPGVVEPPAEGPSVEELLDGFMAEIRPLTGAVAGRIVLGGFSQGGGLTLRYGLLRPETFAGLAVLSGFFRGAEELRPRLPAGRGQAIFIAHGSYDQMISLDQAQQTRSFLEELAYKPEYHEYVMGHEVTGDVIADLTPWLHAVLPPIKGKG